MPSRILIIEDDPDSLDLMSYLLKSSSYVPLIARDGEEGLAVIYRERPDLVICDIQLPKVDGQALTQLVKAHPSLRGIALIAVTAYAMVGDRDRILSSGFDGYIPKPIVPDLFVRQIEGFLRDTAPGEGQKAT